MYTICTFPMSPTLRQVAMQAYGYTVGPMPAKDFLDMFSSQSQQTDTVLQHASHAYIPTGRCKPFMTLFLFLTHCRFCINSLVV